MKARGASIAVGILLVGWVASVGIRTWKGVSVDVVAEMIGAGVASATLYSRMVGRPPNSGEDAK